MAKLGGKLDGWTKSCCEELKLECIFHMEYKRNMCIAVGPMMGFDWDKILKAHKPISRCCNNMGAKKGIAHVQHFDTAMMQPKCK